MTIGSGDLVHYAISEWAESPLRGWADYSATWLVDTSDPRFESARRLATATVYRHGVPVGVLLRDRGSHRGIAWAVLGDPVPGSDLDSHGSLGAYGSSEGAVSVLALAAETAIAEAGEVDWRPAMTLPEDYYA